MRPPPGSDAGPRRLRAHCRAAGWLQALVLSGSGASVRKSRLSHDLYTPGQSWEQLQPVSPASGAAPVPAGWGQCHPQPQTSLSPSLPSSGQTGYTHFPLNVTCQTAPPQRHSLRGLSKDSEVPNPSNTNIVLPVCLCRLQSPGPGLGDTGASTHGWDRPDPSVPGPSVVY